MLYLYSMKRDKQKAIELRKQGKTYKEIHSALNISKSTLCEWFKNKKWSNNIKSNNTKEHIRISTERLNKMNIARQIMLKEKYQKVEEDAIKEFDIYKKDQLFIAGLMLYAGEGDKKSKNGSRMSNSEFYIHKIFIKFAEKYLNIPKNSIKIGLILYPDNNINDCMVKWKTELAVSILNFHKTQVIKGREKIKKLQYGTAISIISTKVVIKKKLLKWLEILSTFEF